jgi:hypothetical protein
VIHGCVSCPGAGRLARRCLIRRICAGLSGSGCPNNLHSGEPQVCDGRFLRFAGSKGFGCALPRLACFEESACVMHRAGSLVNSMGPKNLKSDLTDR